MATPNREEWAALRAQPDVVVLEGFHALKHALRFGAAVEIALTADPGQLERLVYSLAPDLPATLWDVTRGVATLDGLVERVPPTQVIALARRPPERDPLAEPGRVVLLEDPRHLGNVGAVVRVAAAAGAAAVATTGTADPWAPAALRGAAGLHFALPVARVARVPDGVVAVDPGGDPLEPAAVPADAVLAFGSERRGLSEDVLTRARARVRLPMRAGVSSLNLATAVSAALYALRYGAP